MTTQDLLDELFDPADHQRWLDHPQQHFDGLSARQMIENGFESEVQSLLHALADGAVL